MPKDWDHHKAEIERLYMVERLSLKDVRNALKTQFAFDASIRAYRMKLDEWRLWKNNSKNERRRAKTTSRRRRPRSFQSTESEKYVSSSILTGSQIPPVAGVLGPINLIYGVLVPNRPLDISELLPLISVLHEEPECGLEIMLTKWKSDGSYLDAALRYLLDHGSSFRIYMPTLQETSIFHLINKYVADDGEFRLAKMCLEIDFQQTQEGTCEIPQFLPSWMKSWRDACKCSSWEDVKKCLNITHPEFRGQYLFSSTALNFLAEMLLEKNMDQLERLGDRRFRCTGAFDMSQVDVCLRESMDILNSFKDATLFDVDVSWYKQFVQHSELLQPHHHLHQTRQSDQLEEYRNKFLQLKSLHESVNNTNGLVENLLNASHLIEKSKEILDRVQCEGVSSTDENISPPLSTPTAGWSESHLVMELPTFLKDLHHQWGWGEDITDNVERLVGYLSNFDTSCVISDPSNPKHNLFILISQIIPRNDQVPLTSAILSAIEEWWDLLPAGGGVRWDHWDTWTIVHASSSLESLKKAIYLPSPLRFYVDDSVGPDVVKLIIDASVGFVGEHLLWKLKTSIKRRHAKGLIYDIYIQDYKAVLDALYRRKVNVRQDLFAFLGRLLVWEGTDEDSDDEDKHALFETSDEESNESENDTVECDSEPGDEEEAANVSMSH